MIVIKVYSYRRNGIEGDCKWEGTLLEYAVGEANRGHRLLSAREALLDERLKGLERQMKSSS